MPVQCSGAVPDEDLICAIVEFTLPTELWEALRDLAEGCIVTDQLGGGTQCEAAALLRHATIATTNTFYARSPDEPSPDPPAPSSASTST